MQHPQARGPVLLPRGNLALPILPCLLTAAGFSSVTLPAYWCAASAWEPRQVPTVVVVASPSALPALPQRVRRSATLVTIGATTGAAARRLAGAVIEAPEPTVEGVLSALRVALGRPPGAELAPREASRPT
jgi:uroporphyrinogen-III synthase